MRITKIIKAILIAIKKADGKCNVSKRELICLKLLPNLTSFRHHMYKYIIVIITLEKVL